MTRNSGSHHHSSDESRRSKQSKSSSSKHSSHHHEGESVRSKSHSTRSAAEKGTLTLGPDGKEQTRLRVVDSTDSDTSEENANEQQMANTFWKKHGSKIGIGAFVVGVIIAVVTTYTLMKGSGNIKKKAINVEPETLAPVPMVPTPNPTIAPTGMPTVEYPPPDLAFCQSLREGRNINDGTLLPRNMDISFDVIIRAGGPFRTEEELMEYFPNQVQTMLIPNLAGCNDVEGFQRKLNSQEVDRELKDGLEQIRYVVAGGKVTGTKYTEAKCPTSTAGQLVTCYNVIVYFEFLLKGDERVFQVMSLISNQLDKTSFGFPNPPFQKVTANGVRNNDPTVSPSVSPTLFPTDKPSLSPSLGPTGKPSVPPTGAPSSKPSASPSGAPSVSPTKGPTRSPTPQPSSLPSVTPSAFPTGDPSIAPSALPSLQPSASPSIVPSLSHVPSLSSAPSSEPTISNAPTSRVAYIIDMLPPHFNDTFTIDWLSNTDLWWADSSNENESALWAERYTLVLFAKHLRGFARPGNSVCGWTNITCDSSGRVKGLELGYNEMPGGIPSELSTLSELTKLDLSHNAYTGTTIPTELFRLVKMEYLDISSSGIGGTIPTQIANMRRLREMHLNSNNLVGTIPRLPELVQRSRDDVITLGNGVIVASVCEMYGNAELQMTEVSAANAGGCDLVRTASDSSSSSSSDDSASSSTSAPATRFRYRSLFRRRNLDEEVESSSEDENEFSVENILRMKMDNIQSPVYYNLHVRAPQVGGKKKKHTKKQNKMKKHTKRAKKYSFNDEEKIAAQFQESEFIDEEK